MINLLAESNISRVRANGVLINEAEARPARERIKDTRRKTGRDFAMPPDSEAKLEECLTTAQTTTARISTLDRICS